MRIASRNHCLAMPFCPYPGCLARLTVESVVCGLLTDTDVEIVEFAPREGDRIGRAMIFCQYSLVLLLSAVLGRPLFLVKGLLTVKLF